MTEQELWQQIDAVLAGLKALADPRPASSEWKKLYGLLKKTPAAGNALDNAILQRNVAKVEALAEPHRPGAAPAAASTEPGIDIATLKAALKAFKRRLKLSRLDEDSKLNSRNPMSAGGGMHISAIVPPGEFGPEVWAELTQRGVLKRSGAGLYEFVKDLA